MKILISGTSFKSSYGGPARSVSQLADALAQLGCEVGLWAPDQSVITNQFLAESCRVLRLEGNYESALAAFGRPDVIHDNGIWLPHNRLIANVAQQQNIPRIVSSRGMLLPWARKHKRIKKWLAWHAYQRANLTSAAAIHATSDSEQQSLHKLRIDRPIFVVPNGVDFSGITSPADSGRLEATSDRTALFVGRLYPVKGLPMLLDAWATVRPNAWRLKIVGPDEAGHLAVLQRKITELRLDAVVELAGPLEGDAKWQAMHDADLFVCPSYTENFGIAIAEAMACGLPVLTTTGTPWSVLKANSMGWWVEPKTEPIIGALRQAVQTPKQQLTKMGLRGQAYVRENFSWTTIARLFVDHYRKVIAMDK